jgi:molybdate transport system substrate-binding protein
MPSRRQAIVWSAAVAAALALDGLRLTAQPAPTLIVAAASDLQTELPDIAARFERETGSTVTLSFGSSGNLFTQIQNGAPFDLFLSADIAYPKQLAASGAADAASLYGYATGRIVLWTRKESGIDVRPGLTVLTGARIRHIAIANPEHAPYGRAAVAALRHEALYDAVKGKFVLGENIAQTAQFAESGNAEVGIISLSLALAPALRGSGSYVAIPSASHPPIEQGAIVVSGSRNKPLASRFIAYLKQPDIKRLLDQAGFTTPR